MLSWKKGCGRISNIFGVITLENNFQWSVGRQFWSASICFTSLCDFGLKPQPPSQLIKTDINPSLVNSVNSYEWSKQNFLLQYQESSK